MIDLKKAPKVEEVKQSLSPKLGKLYEDDVFVITVYKAFPFILQLFEEGHRSMVNLSNMDTIGPVQIAANYDIKLLQLFADRGEQRVAELAESEKQKP